VLPLHHGTNIAFLFSTRCKNRMFLVNLSNLSFKKFRNCLNFVFEDVFELLSPQKSQN
jgi:hypothetical protein